MVVPITQAELYKADTFFDHPACQQAIACEIGCFGLDAVKIKCALSFLTQIDQLWCAGLHPKSQLIGADPGGDFGISRFRQTLGIEPVDGLQHPAIAGRSCPGGAIEVENGVPLAPQWNPMVGRCQKAVGDDAIVRLGHRTTDGGDEAG